MDLGQEGGRRGGRASRRGFVRRGCRCNAISRGRGVFHGDGGRRDGQGNVAGFGRFGDFVIGGFVESSAIDIVGDAEKLSNA